MPSCVWSQRVCRVVAGLNRASTPTIASLLRTHVTSTPKCGDVFRKDSVVTYSQLKLMLSNRDIQLFDVRNQDEYKQGHIAGAVNIPLGNLEESLQLSPDDFRLKFEVKAPGREDDNIVFHCRSVRRSSRALDVAWQLGFSRARHYEGGYSEWAQKEGEGVRAEFCT